MLLRRDGERDGAAGEIEPVDTGSRLFRHRGFEQQKTAIRGDMEDLVAGFDRAGGTELMARAGVEIDRDEPGAGCGALPKQADQKAAGSDPAMPFESLVLGQGDGMESGRRAGEIIDDEARLAVDQRPCRDAPSVRREHRILDRRPGKIDRRVDRRRIGPRKGPAGLNTGERPQSAAQISPHHSTCPQASWQVQHARKHKIAQYRENTQLFDALAE